MNVRIVQPAGLLLCLSTAICAGPIPTVFTVDENGNGSFATGNNLVIKISTALTSGLAVDPISGISTLRYTLPGPVSGGDVLLIGASDGGGPSDVLRFIDGTPFLFFFSFTTLSDAADTLADTATGLVLQTPNTAVLETGPEGNNGSVGYTPTTGMPGFTGTAGDRFNFISDSSLPEPSSLGLGGFGLALMLLRRCRISMSMLFIRAKRFQ